MARIRISGELLVIPDAWRDAIAGELESAGDVASLKAARRLREDSGDEGPGASLLSASGDMKRATLVALERLRGRSGETPVPVIVFEEKLRRFLGLLHVDTDA